MTRYLALVKLLFTQQYRMKPVDGKKKRAGTIAVFIILGVCMLPMLIGLVVATYYLGSSVGKDMGVASLMILVCQGLVLLFGAISVISNVFNGKDADRLLFLPVRPITIFLAKLTVVYLNEVITTAALILFAMIPFGIGAHVAAGYYLMLPFTLLLVPVLPLFVACLFAIPLSALLTKVRRNNVLKTILQLLLLGGIMVGYFLLYFNIFNSAETDGSIASGVEGMVDQLVDKLRNAGSKMIYVHPDMMLATAMLASQFGSWILAFLLTVAENAALLALVILAALPFYKWILAASLETGAGKRRRKGSLTEQVQVKNKGVLKELMSTDIKRVIRNPQFGFQAFASLIISPLIIVLFYFAFNQSDENGVKLLDVLVDNTLYQAIAPLVVSAYMSMLGVGSNVLGLYPISRENKALYLLKSMPISFEKILLAKVLLATISMLITGFVTCVLSVVLLGIKWYIGIGMMIVMALAGFGGLSITTLLDLKSPKLGWTNFNQGLKNAKNSWIAMLVGFLTTMAMVLIAAGFVIWCVLATTVTETLIAICLMWLVVVGVLVAYAIVSYRIMTRNAASNFAKIEP